VCAGVGRRSAICCYFVSLAKVAGLRNILRALQGRLLTYRALWSARRLTHNNLLRPARRVLVICYGNIYRSAFLAAYLSQQAQGQIEVRSSGFHKKTGRPSPDRHIAMSSEVGVDLSQHRSSRVTSEDIEWADIVVAMDRHNWHALWLMDTPSHKIIWAGALTKGSVEIGDPYQLTDQAAKQTIDRLREAGDGLLKRLTTKR
jgi:protein-tyrosine-phosphatase